MAADIKSLSELATIISTPDALAIFTVPSEFALALKSPIVALLIAVTTAAALVAADKSTLEPFILNEVLPVA